MGEGVIIDNKGGKPVGYTSRGITKLDTVVTHGVAYFLATWRIIQYNMDSCVKSVHTIRLSVEMSIVSMLKVSHMAMP